MNRPSMENLLSTGSYQEELYANALGWKTPELFILNRAIVISVKVGVDVSPQGSANLPQFSINARIIGEDFSNRSPENEVTRWYAPLMSNTIISVPDVGEQVFVIRETTLNKSKGYWIARVNDTDTVSLHLTNDQNKPENPSPMARYGMRFDVDELSLNSRQNSPKKSKKVFQLPLNLGDVLMQGRSGSYIRHSYLPVYDDFPGTLEMGILEDRAYQTSPVGTVGSTKTKTVHFSNTRPTDISSIFEKAPVDFDSTDTNPRRNFIANISDENYTVSIASDSSPIMHRIVLGERLNQYMQKQEALIREFMQSTLNLNNIVQTLFDSYLNHEHAIPEINIDIPDKVISDKQTVNLGFRTVRQPNRRVFIPASRVSVPPSGDVYKTVRINTPVGPRNDRVLVAKGRPGSTVIIPSKFVSVPSPPRTINLGYRVRTFKRRIRFDAISIGGSENPRMTVPIETSSETSSVQEGLNDIIDDLSATNRKFLLLTQSLEQHLSRRNFVN